MAQGSTYGNVTIDQTTNIIAATTMQNAAVAVGNGVNLNVQGYVSAIISITGTMAGTTITFNESPDDVIFRPIAAHQLGVAGNLSTTTTSNGEYRISCAGLKSLQAVITTYGSGTITAKGTVSVLPGHPTTINSNIIAALPTGTNTIGAVTGSFVEQAGLTVSALNAFLVASTDVSAYKSFSIQISTIPITTVLSLLGSNDNSLWYPINCMQQGLGTSTTITQITSTGIYNGGTGFRYLRIQQTSGSTGTSTGTLELYGWPFIPTNIGISGTVNGVGGAGTVITNLGNPFSVVGQDSGSIARYLLTNATGAMRNQPIDPTAFTLSSAASTNATNVKNATGTLYQITCSNVGGAIAFVKLFNTATAPTVGTTVPVLTMAVPANGVPLNINFDALGMRFSAGISLSITNLVGDSDATAVAAAQIKVMATYV